MEITKKPWRLSSKPGAYLYAQDCDVDDKLDRLREVFLAMQDAGMAHPRPGVHYLSKRLEEALRALETAGERDANHPV